MLIGQLKEALTQRATACYTEQPYELHPATSRPASHFLVLRGSLSTLLLRGALMPIRLALHAWSTTRSLWREYRWRCPMAGSQTPERKRPNRPTRFVGRHWDCHGPIEPKLRSRTSEAKCRC